MKELSYLEALSLAKKYATDLAEKRELRGHCEKYKLNYHNVFTFIRTGDRIKKQPKLISDFLTSVGYRTSLDKQIIYKFILDTDETSHLIITNILEEELKIREKEYKD